MAPSCWRANPFRSLLAVLVVLMLAQGVAQVMLVALVTQSWHGRPEDLGLLASAQGVGALIGGPAVALLARRASPRTLIAGGVGGAGGLMLVIVNQPHLLLGLALYLPLGMCIVAITTAAGTLVQLSTDNDYLGRVAGWFAMATAGAAILGALAAAGLGGMLGPRLLLSLSAVLMLLAALPARSLAPSATTQ